METFQESRDSLNQCLAKFRANHFPCCVAWCFASARPCLVFRLCEAVFSLMQIPRETLLHKSRSAIKFCDILSIHCFQLACVVLVCFFCPVVEVFVHTSHMMSHRTWCRPMTSLLVFSCATCLLDSANQKLVSSCLISAIFSQDHKYHPADRQFHSGCELLDLQPYSVGLCETHPLTAERNFKHN